MQRRNRGIVGIAAAAVSMTLACGQADGERRVTQPVIVATDASLLATTGQPQLVEFFHPT